MPPPLFQTSPSSPPSLPSRCSLPPWEVRPGGRLPHRVQCGDGQKAGGRHGGRRSLTSPDHLIPRPKDAAKQRCTPGEAPNQDRKQQGTTATGNPPQRQRPQRTGRIRRQQGQTTPQYTAASTPGSRGFPSIPPDRRTSDRAQPDRPLLMARICDPLRVWKVAAMPWALTQATAG